MATDKRLDQVSNLTDFDYALIVKGEQVSKISKADLASVVAGLIPPVKIDLNPILATQFTLPAHIINFAKIDAGDAIKTLTVCKRQTSHFCHINLFLTPRENNFYAGSGRITFGCPYYNVDQSFACDLSGYISNPRMVSYDGEIYLAVDIKVRQYGGCSIYFTGIHTNREDFIDITGKI